MFLRVQKKKKPRVASLGKYINISAGALSKMKRPRSAPGPVLLRNPGRDNVV